MRAAILAITLALVATVATFAPSSRADTPALPDGLTQATAAGSCWEVKQNTPSAPSGLYWLLTPALKAPQQFYCDQVTDGGGWVLIGRGREGWRASYTGYNADKVHTTVDGVDAFKPAQYSSTTVDALLNGARVDSLSDGIRLRRATNTAGTSWQESRFKITNSKSWVWAFGSEMVVSSYNFGSGNGSGGQTNNFGQDNAYRRVVTAEASNQGFLWGFAYGGSVTGTTAATSYLWSNTNGLGNARPFTQVYLRPQLTIAGMNFGTIPDSGTTVQEQTPLAESGAIATSWGVSGFANGSAGELNTEVAAFAEVGDRVFVGGNFRYAQRSSTGTGQVERPYLAAFDRATGEFIPTFVPQLNGQVKALVALPDGRLAVGGQFTIVNGESRPALAILDPITGQLSGWQVLVENRTTGGTPQVRGLDVQNGQLYVAGGFTHLTRVGQTYSASAWNGGRINLASGNADTSWNAALNGTTIDVDASADGTRTYYSGYFKYKGTTQTPSGAALQTVSGAPLVNPVWRPTFSKSGVDGSGNVTGNVWQLGVQEAGGRVWLGGSEHSLFNYDPTTFQFLDGSITKAGGDFQTVDAGGTAAHPLIYAGCHCGDWVYQHTKTWSEVSGWSRVDEITLIGAWDATTGLYQPEFSPVLSARAGYGAWAAFQDSSGVLWVGGDFSGSVRTNGNGQWSGGFVRFAARDTAAPTTPTALTATPGADGTTLSWAGSTDDRGSVVYEVIRGNRVIATTTSLSLAVPASDDTQRYFVRAADSAGNRSASTAVLTVEPAPEFDVLVATGSAWSWRFSGDALPAAWNQPGFDASSWSTGSAILGVNAAGQATNLNAAAPSPRPLSAQFIKHITVSDPASLSGLKLSVVADDGVVVYVNGVEVGRSRLPAGALTQNTYASSVITSATAIANPVVFDVPASLLVDGDNVIAASTHANYRTTPNLSFDLSLIGERGDELPPPSAVTGLSASASGTSAAALTWTPGAGTAAVSYRVERDGAVVATVAAPATSVTDSGLVPATAYSYSVTAIDAFGRESAPATVAFSTPEAEAPPGAVTGLSADAGPTTVTLSWTAGTGTAATYQVLRGGLVVGTVEAPLTTFADSGLSVATQYLYEVVAVSSGGVHSAPASLEVTTDPDPHVQLVANGSSWSWRYSSDALPATWNQPGFDASTWSTGSAILGINAVGQVTNLNAAALSPRPLSAQFVQHFAVTGAASLTEVKVTVVADDGVVVYVNGTEVGRERLPAGTLTQNSYATAAPSSASALANRITFTVPVSLLVEGDNVIAASTHANYRTTPNLTFDLALEATRIG